MLATRLTAPAEITTLASKAAHIFAIPGEAQVNTVRAAEILTTLGFPVAPATLMKWRSVRSDGPRFSKVGTGRVVYRVADLRTYAGLTGNVL